MNWSLEHIKRLKEKGAIVDYKINEPKNNPVAKQYKKLKQKESPELIQMKRHLMTLNIPFVEEHKFLKNRRFRFDIAIPEIMIAFEYEGVMSKKSRHTTVQGYSNDTIKYNLAQREGWKVYRYTVINYKDFFNDIKGILQ